MTPAIAHIREFWMFVGLAAYFIALRLVLKYQTRPMMRRARITVFSFTLASILVIALLKMGVDWRKIETFKTNGVVTQATVTRKFYEPDLPRFGGTKYKVDYTYTDAGGNSHTNEDYVSYKVWKPLAAGGKVEIEYLSGDSSASSVNSWDAYHESIHVCLALTLVSGVALFWALKKSLPPTEKIHP
jgi:hypothetical protein